MRSSVHHINRVVNRLRTFWLENPELRFGQLIGNVTASEIDLYYMEDDRLLMLLEAVYANTKAPGE